MTDEYLYYYDRYDDVLGRLTVEGGDEEEVFTPPNAEGSDVRALRYHPGRDEVVVVTRPLARFVNPENGEMVRSVVTDEWNDVPTAIGDDTLYVSTDYPDETYAFVARDIESGKDRWTWDIGEHDRTGDLSVESAPAVTDDRVFIYGTNNVLAAVDSETGDEIWAVDVFEGPSERGGFPGPLVAGDTVYVAGSERIHAHDADTGEERWRLNDVGTRRAMAVSPGVLIVNYWDGPLHAIAEPR